jgi:hypothetical protein
MSLPLGASPFGTEYSAFPSKHQLPHSMMRDIDTSDAPLEIQRIQAEIEMAEVELKLARAKTQYLQMKERLAEEAKAGVCAATGTRSEPHSLEED